MADIASRFELDITSATQYATAYLDGQPVATFQRRRTYETGPGWSVYDTAGRLLMSGNSYGVLMRRLMGWLERGSLSNVG